MSEFVAKDTGLVLEETRIEEKSQWGSGSNIFKVDLKQGIFIGATKYDTAPFRVSFAGICNVVDIILSGGTISYGKASYTDDTNAGYWLGNVTGTPKFNIGSSSTKYFHYDGTDLVMLGGTITGGIVQTAATGNRVILNGSKISFNIDGDEKGYISPDSANSMIYCTDSNFYFFRSDDNWFATINSDGIQIPSGNYITVGGLDGETPGAKEFCTSLRFDGSQLQAKFRAITFTGGVMTDMGSESGWRDIN